VSAGKKSFQNCREAALQPKVTWGCSCPRCERRRPFSQGVHHRKGDERHETTERRIWGQPCGFPQVGRKSRDLTGGEKNRGGWFVPGPRTVEGGKPKTLGERSLSLRRQFKERERRGYTKQTNWRKSFRGKGVRKKGQQAKG